MTRFKNIFFPLLLLTIIVGGCTDFISDELNFENSTITRSVDSKMSYSDYYWLEKEKIPVQKVEGKYQIMYYASDANIFSEKIARANLEFEGIKEWGKCVYPSTKKANSNTIKFTDLKVTTIQGDYNRVSSVLSDAFYWAPYYKMKNGNEIGITNLFYVKLKSETNLSILKELAKENAVELIGADEFLQGCYYLACTNLSKRNALEMANLFYESGLFEFASPSLSGAGNVDCINEPLFEAGSLWHLGNNLTKSYVHVNYCKSRTIISQGSSDVIVAIIDTGVDVSHRDLYNVLPGWDAVTQTTPNRVRGAHGTMVTGFIGAIPNNSQGVAGIAYGTTILPISFAVNNLGGIISSDITMTRAIEYAVNNGAKVINCSWQYDSTLVGEAIKSALDNGCVVVFASGNGGGAISYPANSDSRIIVVGAIDQNGNRASFSNYGNQLDIVAPGENVYSLYPDNTTVMGSGTSFAAPQVTGVAAMVLSKYPALTASEVRYRIEKTAQKITSSVYPYTFQTLAAFATSNNQMGYGLLDSYAALAPQIPYLLKITIRNLSNHRPMGAFNVNLYNLDWSQVQDLTEISPGYGTLFTGEEFTARYDLLPGSYYAEATAEMDGVEEDLKFDFVKGGEITFEYFNTTYPPVGWGIPVYSPN